MQSAICGQAVARRSVLAFQPARRAQLVIQNAHKQGAGSTKNGRDSNAKRRGVKVYGGQPVKAGGIIVRQVGTKWHAGENCDLGKDYTLFSTVDGIVIFDAGKKDKRPQVHVFAHESEQAKAMVAKTHTAQSKDGGASRAERRQKIYKPRTPKAQVTLGVATVTAAAAMRP